jgi:hypothetical protein
MEEANETMKLPGERNKRNLPLEGEMLTSSGEGGNDGGTSMESSSQQ